MILKNMCPESSFQLIMYVTVRKGSGVVKRTVGLAPDRRLHSQVYQLTGLGRLGKSLNLSESESLFPYL